MTGSNGAVEQGLTGRRGGVDRLDPGNAEDPRKVESSTKNDSERLDQAALTASANRDWGQLQRLWLNTLRFVGFEDHPLAITAYADIPEEARRRYPSLTWARAVAIAHGAPPPERDRVVVRTFLRDAVSLHADWQRNPDTDAAVLAGTMWLSSQQSQSVEGRGADEAWRTRNAVAAFLEERRQHGEPPSDDTAAVFHAKSAQLALMRADIGTTVTEADRAIILSPGPAAQVSAGLRSLALELHGTPDHLGPETVDHVAALDQPDLLGRASTPARVAEAARAIRLLDHEAAQCALESLDGTYGEPCWPLRVALAATVGAIWGSPEETLVQLDGELGRNSVLSMEHQYPLGRVALIRVRSLLLCKLNIPSDALSLARSLDLPWSWVPVTRAQLWTGDLDGAIETARSGLFVDPSTWHSDRVALSVLKAAAMTSSTARDGEEQEAAFVRALTACTRSQSVSPLAFLPDFGRRALLDYHDRRGCTGCILCDRVTKARLTQLPGAGREGVLIRLTGRERDLLPLLATPEPVPAIARQLHLSVGTVRKQVAALRAKFDAHSRHELVRRARETGHLRGS